MKTIYIMGTGCKKCNDLEENVKSLIQSHQWQAQVAKITDYADILNRGVIKTPALAIDDTLVFSGASPSLKKLEKLLEGKI